MLIVAFVAASFLIMTMDAKAFAVRSTVESFANDSKGDVMTNNPDFDIRRIGIDAQGNPYIRVYGTIESQADSVSDSNVFYFYEFGLLTDSSVDYYIVTLDGPVNSSNESDENSGHSVHSYQLESLNYNPANCPNGDGVELFTTEAGDPKIGHNKITLVPDSDENPTSWVGAFTTKNEIEIVDGHTCIISSVGLDSLPDGEEIE